MGFGQWVWPMGFGQWGLANGFGQWGLANGVWPMGFGQWVWPMGFGQWGLANGVWPMGFGQWGLANGTVTKHPTPYSRLAKPYYGQGGIRTRETLSGPHAFQACALSHSATCPKCGRRAVRRRDDEIARRSAGPPVSSSRLLVIPSSPATDRVGFEPTIPFPVCRFSRPVPSATRTPVLELPGRFSHHASPRSAHQTNKLPCAGRTPPRPAT